METYGTLTIRLLVIFKGAQNCQETGKSVVLETIHNVTREQARGWVLDWKGMNGDRGYDKRLITGEWVSKETFS